MKKAQGFSRQLLIDAIWQAFYKMNPKVQLRNPVMFLVWVGCALTTMLLLDRLYVGDTEVLYELQIIIWLWFTVLFANFAEAVAEGRGKAQANALRGTRGQTPAKRWENGDWKAVDAATGAEIERLVRGDADLGGPGGQADAAAHDASDPMVEDDTHAG